MDEDDQLRRPNAISDSRYDRPLKAKADVTGFCFNNIFPTIDYFFKKNFV